MASEGPYAINSDGTAKDAAAFRAALQADSGKMTALQADPEVLKVVTSGDMDSFQQVLRTAYAVIICASSAVLAIASDRIRAIMYQIKVLSRIFRSGLRKNCKNMTASG